MPEEARPGDRASAAPWFIGESKPPLSRARIVEAAHALVHQGGVDALTLRALARELGVGTSAIYRRIDDKDHLLVGVADLVLSEVPVSDGRPTARTWRAALRTISDDVRAVLEAHPHIHPVLDSHLLVTPAAVRIADQALSALRAAGFSGDHIANAYNAWAGYVFGFSLVEAQPSAGRAERLRLREWARPYLRGLDPGMYPALAEVLPELENRAFALRWEAGPLGPRGESFAFGLEALLNGLDAGRSPSPGRRPGPG